MGIQTCTPPLSWKHESIKQTLCFLGHETQNVFSLKNTTLYYEIILVAIYYYAFHCDITKNLKPKKITCDCKFQKALR